MKYESKLAHYKTQRVINKEIFNALLNDEFVRYSMDKDQVKTLSITHSDLKKRLIKRHPPLKSILGKGVQLGLHYIDLC